MLLRKAWEDASICSSHVILLFELWKGDCREVLIS